ncbi:hypothetical protein [Bradyrhizobium sp. CCBAU 21362]|uniref:hypothetical protein n=1 Tax=Bradyrhizobium sp. CCBAU 21362 TaxID=1325082 RepID=UPI002305429F|nr:hypothetical protein [Bradyrhizobium sp. CCBAU 21362]
MEDLELPSREYHSSFSIASPRDCTGRSVRSFHSIFFLPRLLIVSPDSRDNLARRQAETPLIILSRFPEPALSSIAPDVTIPAPRPDVGGGVANIAFLEGKGVPKAGGPNGVTQTVTTTFWIEQIDDGSGQPALQLQYTQRVLLNFSGLSWPHITVGTLRPV